MQVYSIEDFKKELVVSIDSNNQLVCSPSPTQACQQLPWYKCFVDDTDYKNFVIISAANTGNIQAITCSVEGEDKHCDDDYLWKEEDEHIVSVRCGDVIGAQDTGGMQVSPILCEKDSESKKFKMIVICK